MDERARGRLVMQWRPTVVLMAAVAVCVGCSKNEGAPLRSAIGAGHVAEVQALVEAGADVNLTNDYGSTPLSFAAFCGHLDVVEYLVDAGADVNVVDNHGETPLHDAAANGHLDVVRYLVEQGVDIDAGAAFGDLRTPLREAIFYDHLDVVEYLVEQGADINAVDVFLGSTLLRRIVPSALGQPGGVCLAGWPPGLRSLACAPQARRRRSAGRKRAWVPGARGADGEPQGGTLCRYRANGREFRVDVFPQHRARSSGGLR